MCFNVCGFRYQNGKSKILDRLQPALNVVLRAILMCWWPIHMFRSGLLKPWRLHIMNFNICSWATLLAASGAITPTTKPDAPEVLDLHHSLPVHWTEVVQSICFEDVGQMFKNGAFFCHSCSNVSVVLTKVVVQHVIWTCDPLKFTIVEVSNRGSRENTLMLCVAKCWNRRGIKECKCFKI